MSKSSSTGDTLAAFLQQEIGGKLDDAKTNPSKVIPSNAIEIAKALGDFIDKSGYFRLSDVTKVATAHGATDIQAMGLLGYLTGGPIEIKCFRDGIEQPKSAFAEGVRRLLSPRETDIDSIEVRWCPAKPADLPLAGPSPAVTLTPPRHHQK